MARKRHRDEDALRLLREAGYRTAIAGKIGFEVSDEPGGKGALPEGDFDVWGAYDTFWQEKQLRPQIGLRMNLPVRLSRRYAALAEAVGRPSAIRAVGRTNGDNRLAIIVPCHRVVGADGSLTGYGGGIWRKRRLLEIEGVELAPLGDRG